MKYNSILLIFSIFFPALISGKESLNYKVVSKVGINPSEVGQVAEATSDTDTEIINEIANMATNNVAILDTEPMAQTTEKEKISDQDQGEKMVEKMLESFKIQVDAPETSKEKKANSNKTYSKDPRKEIKSSVNVKSTENASKNMKSDSKAIDANKNMKKTPQDLDKDIQNLTKKFFSRKNKPKRNASGKVITYYKDSTSVPVIFRKVIPPRGAKLPGLNFEFIEGDSTCRCICKF